MHSAIAVVLSTLALVSAQAKPVPGVTGALGNADVVSGNPAGVVYTATLPNSKTTGVSLNSDFVAVIMD